MEILTLTFQVKQDDGTMTAPKWREVQTQNDGCPKCRQRMIVINGTPEYAYCLKCKTVYIAE